jgi:hypothetical protein
VDILGSWRTEEQWFDKDLRNVIKVPLADLEPYYFNNPWTTALEGKRVLVIHPFEDTIRKQYARLDTLFADKQMAPNYELLTIKAVQSIAGNKPRGFNNWFEALDWMKMEIDKLDFDIAIVGCGAYGFPLAAYVKQIGKKAIHLGGAVQYLFGIRSNAGEQSFRLKPLMNKNWVYPSQEETPKGFEKVEGNITKYRNGTLDPALTTYYNENEYKCLTQNVKVAVPSGVLSLIIAGTGKQYNYADKCEVELVRKIVGGFEGSPSLLLFSNGKLADDLNGRATTAVIREILFTWGLTQLGTLMNLETFSSLTTMGVTLSSAQKANNMKYFLSTSTVPTCSGNGTSVNQSNYTTGAYIGATSPSKGIKIDIINDYKTLSNQLLQPELSKITTSSLTVASAYFVIVLHY